MAASRTKIIIFLIFVSLVLLLSGQYFLGRAGLLIGFLFAVGLNTTVFFLGENQILRKLGAKPLKGRDPWGLDETVRRLAAQMKVPTPRLYVIESNAPTAFSFGLDHDKPCLCVTTDLLSRFEPKEVEAILAHQLCQLARSDSFAFAVLSIFTHALVSLAEILDSLLPTQLFVSRPHRFFQYLVFPFAWVLLRTVVSPKTFYETDARTGDLLADRHGLGDILWRLNTLAHTRPLPIPAFTSHMFIVDPSGTAAASPLTRFHPPIGRRLRKLTGSPTA